MTHSVARRAGGPEQRCHVTELGRINFTAPAHGTAVAVARHAARAASLAWGNRMPGVAVDAVLLILSELLGNAVKAATGGTVTMLLSWTHRRVRIEVSDDSAQQPIVRRAAPTDEGGRGLWIVDMLAVRWGASTTCSGKCVWAEVALPA